MITVEENGTRIIVEQVDECTANIIITSPVVIGGSDPSLPYYFADIYEKLGMKPQIETFDLTFDETFN